MTESQSQFQRTLFQASLNFYSFGTFARRRLLG